MKNLNYPSTAQAKSWQPLDLNQLVEIDGGCDPLTVTLLVVIAIEAGIFTGLALNAIF